MPVAPYRYVPDFLASNDADRLLHALLQDTPWGEERIKLFGRERLVPRLVAWSGAAGLDYRYSGRSHQTDGWDPKLIPLRDRLQDSLATTFNFVLMNRYRYGSDSMGWHTDDEATLTGWIASVSLGEERRLLLRDGNGETNRLSLAHGSMLALRVVDRIPHALPKTRRCIGERINLTFRSLRT